ncbi:bifunctional (p)ppGpp synthetase/guanosine-3',5'-bis(diphosphate) 3'-pyrophosphohydrolase [Pseudoglutamicibacter cumminsii]|uniref:RelA/SpoT family protein n=1 Tax=Pseudoglutamicibacter cumminsii TaxID=156979 RepID=UPI0025568EF2|nr:bifunctional (p)ppGpp synthetase/guanosine-3',5'-bis(diphosphate) 3'-pyrophosphohydrolase [Pseudoglutamicibacter cumminsii]MDK7082655.1 bifunctional (p)ppGpp synthetase/guanosine-3',5'-bis(diphosphate) 3'-pyrophosphohydrolase [Pseudoglutamicibacter cumminsii]
MVQQRVGSQPPRRGRSLSRLIRFSGRSSFPAAPPILEPLLRTVRAQNPDEDLTLITRAYDVAAHWHEGVKRKSGDPYITHPVAVATILAEMGLTGATLAAALLHDTVEDTEYSLEALRKDFGDEIALLVDGVTKLDKVTYGEAAQAETVRKMIVAMSQDIRVLMIKLADRMHNARTWRYVNPESAAKKARETLEIYAPLAHRLGMNTVKWELEDLSFAVLHPKVYEEIVRMVGARTPERERYLAQVRQAIEANLSEQKIKAVITGRPKHYYSVYQKMVVRKKDFNEIHDLMGVRILVDSVKECYAVLGIIHAHWNPLPGRFKDYIAMPKFNMYQSLHTSVIGPGGRPIEVQIRTHEMHQRAEYGVAAHWKYKQGSQESDQETSINWLNRLVAWQKDTQDPDEFLDSLRYVINSAEVYVFTPAGEVRSLPLGSTPVDFAYAVHTDVGHRAVGAKVNGKLVPLHTPLNNGDQVEILTSKAENAGPSRHWQDFVASPRARTKIRQWFSKERREEAVEKGQELLSKAIRKAGLPLQKLMTAQILNAVAQELHYNDITGLYAGLGEGHVSSKNVMEHITSLTGEPEVAAPEPGLDFTSGQGASHRSQPSSSGVIVQGSRDVMAKLAPCCSPVPPDSIKGFVTRGSGVTVHRAACPNIANLSGAEAERIVEVAWDPRAHTVFTVEIQVEALDRHSLLSDVTKVLSENHVNILSANLWTTKDRTAISRFRFQLGEPDFMSHIFAAIRRIEGVYDVSRVLGGSSKDQQ